MMSLKNLIFFNALRLGMAAALLLAGSASFSSEARAQGGLINSTVAPTSCDPEYMDALEARAYMEAQREISQNKNLIYKPDSVLEYTCFDNFLAHLANSDMFSEIGCCGSAGLGATSLDTALNVAVSNAMLTYLNSNFPYQKYLDGRVTITSYTPSGAQGRQYSCDVMQQVWDMAKCQNFMDEDNHDGFFDFAWYATNDPRKYSLDQPWSNANSCGLSGKGPIPASVQNVAYNNQTGSYVLPVENKGISDTTPYQDDPVRTYFAQILPFGANLPGGGTVTCADPILTGVTVTLTNGTTYPDGVCPNPGCHVVVNGGAPTCVGP